MPSAGSAEFDHYFRASRPEVARLIPDGVKTALDVGCAAGGFGSGMKKLGIEVWGIEPNPEAFEEASQRLDCVLRGTYREVESELPEGRFDLIVFNDVLEHMADCFEVLSDVKRLLSPTGRVLASIPSIRHWPALMTILWRGDFPYQDQGTFDRTHLRFFTHKSMMRMFEECGYEVERCEGINGFVGRKLRIANFLTRGRFWESEFLQFAILAKPVRGSRSQP
jgi:2-polyprenyl-3-methyl-5-hydroxy-6-metoxy-1,4-benzoquinol methylase